MQERIEKNDSPQASAEYPQDTMPSPEHMKAEIEVSLRSATGLNWQITIPYHSTVEEFKEEICKLLKIPRTKGSMFPPLVFAGKLLDNEKTLIALNIEQKATVTADLNLNFVEHLNHDDSHKSEASLLENSTVQDEESLPLILKVFPTELMLALFSFFSPKELGALALVCHQFNRLANDNILWKKQLTLEAPTLCKQLSSKEEVDYKDEYKKEIDRKIAEKMQAELEALFPVNTPTTPCLFPGFFSSRPRLAEREFEFESESESEPEFEFESESEHKYFSFRM